MVETESSDLHSFNGGQKRLAFYIQRRKNHVIKGRGLPLRLRLSVSDDAPCQNGQAGWHSNTQKVVTSSHI